MSHQDERELLRYTLIGRLFIFLLIIIAGLLPDHDADAFKPPTVTPISFLDMLVQKLFDGFRKWDANYLCFIAERGYAFENTLAFFPLFPSFLGAVSRVAHSITQKYLSLSSCILLSGVVYHLVLSHFIALHLFRLGLTVFGNRRLSFLAALLFILNPASVFFSVLYTESTYFFLTLKGMLNLEHDQVFRASLYFALATATRSNGLLNIGYILYPAFIAVCLFSKAFWKGGTLHNKSIISSFKKSIYWWYRLVRFAFFPLLYGLISASTFIAFQLLAYCIYCGCTFISHFSILYPEHTSEIALFAATHQLRTPSVNHTAGEQNIPSWCSSSVPFSYGFIQQHYWNVGPFRYYEMKQIPNFLLATPIIILSISLSATFYHRAPNTYRTLGISAARLQDRKLLPYVLHTLLLCIYGTTHIHVQVLTRMLLSSCPIIYWYCAFLLLGEEISKSTCHHQERKKRNHTSKALSMRLVPMHVFNPCTFSKLYQRMVVTYFVSYAIMGCILHSNFFPWT